MDALAAMAQSTLTASGFDEICKRPQQENRWIVIDCLAADGRPAMLAFVVGRRSDCGGRDLTSELALSALEQSRGGRDDDHDDEQ